MEKYLLLAVGGAALYFFVIAPRMQASDVAAAREAERARSAEARDTAVKGFGQLVGGFGQFAGAAANLMSEIDFSGAGTGV